MRSRKKLEYCRNMTEFWEAIREFRSMKRRKGEGLRKEVWLEHFKRLLGGIQDVVEEQETENGGGRILILEEEGVEELGREITIEEMQRALGKMKNGKAEGEDGVVIEFIKNLPRMWLENVVEILLSRREFRVYVGVPKSKRKDG